MSARCWPTRSCGLPGVEGLNVLPDGRTLRLTVQAIDPVIKMAARYPLANVICREPSLEDVFLLHRDDEAASGRRRPVWFRSGGTEDAP